MKLLVTGGAGYIGSVVGAFLVETGHDVVVVDDLSKGHRDAVPNGARFLEVDLLDAGRLTEVVAEGFDAVLHFAARSLVGESVEQPVAYFRANVTGTLNLLDAMRAGGVQRLVFSSTAAVYGAPETVPIAEDTPPAPTNPYGASKLAMDEVIRYECGASGLHAISLRYFNVAGAYGAQRERHDPETHLIPLVLRAAASGAGAAVTIHGTDYATPDGTAVRDYIHVEDLARAHLLALAATGEIPHRVYNLGNGAGYSVRQVIDAARTVTGIDIGVQVGPRRAGDPPALVASSARMQSELGWVPQKPTLEAMIADAWASRAP
jgi:UDP-glucose 4-epimerase